MGIQYGLITRDLQDTGKRRVFQNPPPDPTTLADSKPYWVPVEYRVDNQSTGAVPTLQEPSVKTVYSHKIVYNAIIRDKTTQEIEDTKVALVENRVTLQPVDKAQFKLLLSMLNDIRELQSKPPITMAQFKDAVIALMD